MNSRNITTILLFAFSLTLWSQKVKKKTETTPRGITEYHVLKSDKKIKHGKYKETTYGSEATFVSGNFYYGKRDGLWTEYYAGETNLKCQGFYKLNKRVGIWNFYDKFKKSVIQKYNYDTNKLLMSKECDSDDIFEVYIDSTVTETKLDCPPSFIGGRNLLIHNLIQRFAFTLEKNKPNKPLDISDKVSILITKEGIFDKIIITSTKADTHLKVFLEKEFDAIKKDYKGKWLPAELNGKKINACLNIVLNTQISAYNKI